MTPGKEDNLPRDVFTRNVTHTFYNKFPLTSSLGKVMSDRKLLPCHVLIHTSYHALHSLKQKHQQFAAMKNKASQEPNPAPHEPRCFRSSEKTMQSCGSASPDANAEGESQATHQATQLGNPSTKPKHSQISAFNPEPKDLLHPLFTLEHTSHMGPPPHPVS